MTVNLGVAYLLNQCRYQKMYSPQKTFSFMTHKLRFVVTLLRCYRITDINLRRLTNNQE
jgi:hypothetical protein